MLSGPKAEAAKETATAVVNKMKLRGTKTIALAVTVGITLTAWSSAFTVDPTDVAFVRHFTGSVNPVPYKNDGLHFKLPLLDSVDRCQISQRLMKVPEFAVNSIDNQPITLDISMVGTTPPDSCYKLLYGTGKTGAADIEDNVVPVVQDLVGRIVSQQNSVTFSEKRESIQNEVTASLQKVLGETFGVQIRSLQLAKVGYSDSFRQSNDNAVVAKNDAVRAQYEGQKTVTAARAEADKRIEQARGEAQSTVLQADANLKAAKDNAEAVAMQGEGEQKRQQAIISAFGNAKDYLDYIRATRWSGNYPQVMTNGGANGPIVVPIMPQPQ